MSHTKTTGQTPGKAALASFLGSMVEYYDFFIYGSASALVFSHVFFPDAGATTGTLAALATFAVAYIARPIGSFFLGHFGDRIGRKRVLIFTLATMGGSTFLIGCLPSYSVIGVWAPILLVLCRVAQGFSAAGEQSGASSMTLEHSPEGRRGYFTSFTLSGTQAGLVVATLAFIPVAALPTEALYSWGWRVPFWASAIVVVVAMFVRRTLEEPPAFEEMKESQEVVKFPLMVFIRHYWGSFLRIVVCHLYGTISTTVTVFGLGYAVDQWDISRSSMLWTIVISNIGQVVTIPLWARLSDKIGRRPVFAVGALGCAASVFVYFWAITTSNWSLVVFASVLLGSVCYAAPNGVWPSLYAEMFDARVRYTGMAVSTQFANVPQGFLPTIAALMIGTGAFGWVPLAILLAVLCLLAAAAALAGPETAHVPLDQLGHTSRPAAETPAARLTTTI
ncbi:MULTISPECIES: MFS transporter [Streptomyces violaceusniger group]|uniref:MFS transporter n=2 Tax=Streptomyces rhizosphaericus TaxID=114699 RepID=A0ABP3ZTS8_9ACTN|nr:MULTISPECIES: MFS transporter [Streptomyces violaceusniger group]